MNVNIKRFEKKKTKLLIDSLITASNFVRPPLCLLRQNRKTEAMYDIPLIHKSTKYIKKTLALHHRKKITSHRIYISWYTMRVR